MDKLATEELIGVATIVLLNDEPRFQYMARQLTQGRPLGAIFHNVSIATNSRRTVTLIAIHSNFLIALEEYQIVNAAIMKYWASLDLRQGLPPDHMYSCVFI